MEANMLDLKSYLISFKKITEEIIRQVNNDEYDKLDDLFEKRQAIIDLIKKSDCNQEQFKSICFELNIGEFEESLHILMEQKHTSLKEELKKIASSKKVNSNYNQNGYVDSIYFNKKI